MSGNHRETVHSFLFHSSSSPEVLGTHHNRRFNWSARRFISYLLVPIIQIEPPPEVPDFSTVSIKCQDFGEVFSEQCVVSLPTPQPYDAQELPPDKWRGGSWRHNGLHWILVMGLPTISSFRTWSDLMSCRGGILLCSPAILASLGPYNSFDNASGGPP